MGWLPSTLLATLLFVPFYVAFPIVIGFGINAGTTLGIWCVGTGIVLVATNGGLSTADGAVLKLAGIVLLSSVTIGALANFLAAQAMIGAALDGVPAGVPAAILGCAPVIAIFVSRTLAHQGWHPPVDLTWNQVTGVVLAVAALAVFSYNPKS